MTSKSTVTTTLGPPATGSWPRPGKFPFLIGLILEVGGVLGLGSGSAALMLGGLLACMVGLLLLCCGLLAWVSA